MRFSKLVVVSAVALAACGGGDTKTTSTTTTSNPPAATTTPAATPAPITGATQVVQMLGGDAKGSRYEPPAITIKTGDGIRFEAVSASPHNVAFDAATLPAPAKTALMANMSEQISELSGKLVNDKESYTISFGNVPAGTYDAFCTPHLAAGMKMKITVQ